MNTSMYASINSSNSPSSLFPSVNNNNIETNPEVPSPKTKTKISFFSSKNNKKIQQYSQDDIVKIYHNKVQVESFLRDFETRLWFSYRKDFDPIQNSALTVENFDKTATGYISSQSSVFSSGKSDDTALINGDSSPLSPASQSFSRYYESEKTAQSKSTSSLTKLYKYFASYTSDTGWGCMMRSGQMLLAQAFMTHYLGRQFRLPPTEKTRNMYLIILSWFYDTDASPYSIHKIARAGKLFGKKIGEWFGPSTISYVLK